METAKQPAVRPSAAVVAERAITELRTRNGVGIAWTRVVVATGTLVPHVASGGLGPPGHRTSLLVLHALAAAHAVAVVTLLARRWRAARVLAAAAFVDVVGLAVGGWVLTTPGFVHEGALAAAAFLLALTEVFVLSAALTLPVGRALQVAAVACAGQLLAAARAGFHPHDLLAAGLTLAAFSGVAAWAGLRFVRLAAGSADREHAALVARQEAEQALAAHAEAAAQRDALIDARDRSEALSAAIVHDLKNPLATLLQYAALAEAQLQETGGPPQALEDLRLVGDEGRRLARLIGDLLLVHRLEAGGLALRPERVPVAPLLAGTAESHRPRASARGAIVEVDAPVALVAHLDPELTQRLLENLVANALRHVGEGDRIRLFAAAADGALTLGVQNSGPPVPLEARPELFEKYATGGRREWHNAGLGLYLCRLVAEAHGGRCALVDRPGWNVSFEASWRDA